MCVTAEATRYGRDMSYALEPGGDVTVPVTVDHGQLIACDPEAELDIDSYGPEATRQGVALWGAGGGITVFTASHWTDTLVTVALHHARPRIDVDECDHVAEAGLSIRSGRLHLYGPEDTNLNEASVLVPTGTYSVIVSGKGFDTTNEYGDEGADTYALHLWPGPLLTRRVLKDGFAWMD
jgi:hypothetical protein